MREPVVLVAKFTLVHIPVLDGFRLSCFNTLVSLRVRKDRIRVGNDLELCSVVLGFRLWVKVGFVTLRSFSV